MTWWIGRAWKAREGCSEAVLRPEGAAVGPSQRRQTPMDHSHTARHTTTAQQGVRVGGGGDGCGVAPPVPIPNTVVQRPSADDTADIDPVGQ